MQHVKKCDVPELLPFARNCLKKLRATGLLYASQKYELGLGTVRVEIRLDQDFIWIEGGGAWVAYPVLVDAKHPGPYFAYRYPWPTPEVNSSPGSPPLLSRTVNPGVAGHPPYEEPYPPGSIFGDVPFTSNSSVKYPGWRFITDPVFDPTVHGPYTYNFSGPIIAEGGTSILANSYIETVSYVETYFGPGGVLLTYSGTSHLAWTTTTRTERVLISNETTNPAGYVLDVQGAFAFGEGDVVVTTTSTGQSGGIVSSSETSSTIPPSTSEGLAFTTEKRTAIRQTMVEGLKAAIRRGHKDYYVAKALFPPPYQRARKVPVVDAPITVTGSGVGSPSGSVLVTETVTQTYTVGGTTASGSAVIKTNLFGFKNVQFTNFYVGDPTVSFDFMRSPDWSSGYLISGSFDTYTRENTLAFSMPDKYVEYARNKAKKPATEDRLIDEAYLSSNASLTLLLLEYESYDPYIRAWAWTPNPYIGVMDPLVIINNPLIAVKPPPEITNLIRAVRFAGAVKQKRKSVEGKVSVWAEAKPLPVEIDGNPVVWERECVCGDLTYGLPTAIAILNTPNSDVLPVADDPRLINTGVIFKDRAGLPDLAAALDTPWNPDVTSDGWIDRLTLEILSATKIVKTS